MLGVHSLNNWVVVMANRYPTFFTRDPLSGAFWCVACTVGLVNLGRFTTPWVLWPLLFLWLYITVSRSVTRSMRLNKKGYFSGRRLNEHWIYEEMQGNSVAALMLPVANTEPGHWELFIPTDSEWRATVPSWAWERRTEIAARIAEGWKLKDIHLPKD
jgi:hypothetical protein